MPIADHDIERLALAILAAADGASSIAPITDGLSDFGLDHAYRVASAVTRLRIARGEGPAGWKIGFTNRTIWEEYGVHAPIWGPMFDTTLAHVDPAVGPAACPVRKLIEPRIEPEIAFRIASPPHLGMEDLELIGCIDAVAHGVEMVQSVFPDWRFKAADTVAAFALHGCYRCGPLVPVAPDERRSWLTMLSDFEITLFCGGRKVDSGIASNVLGSGLLEALRSFVSGLAEHQPDAKLKAGDIVTTGTVTRAFPVKPGEHWRTELRGLPLPGLEFDLA